MNLGDGDSLFTSSGSVSPVASSLVMVVLLNGDDDDVHVYVTCMQADVCHAYQILKKGGIKDDNIVVFMYDDIAMHDMNPRKGIIINHPNGSDVYSGVPKVPPTRGSFLCILHLYNMHRLYSFMTNKS